MWKLPVSLGQASSILVLGGKHPTYISGEAKGEHCFLANPITSYNFTEISKQAMKDYSKSNLHRELGIILLNYELLTVIHHGVFYCCLTISNVLVQFPQLHQLEIGRARGGESWRAICTFSLHLLLPNGEVPGPAKQLLFQDDLPASLYFAARHLREDRIT